MVTRSEYRAGSLSTQQPWLAEGITRRTWERRRRKIAEGIEAPAEGARTTRRRTREEYLAGSLSRQQPWLAKGITRRTWERRRRKIKGARTRRRRGLAADLVNPAPKEPRAAIAPVDDTTPVAAGKRTLGRHDEDLVMRRIHEFWDASGMSHSDPEALAKAIKAIEVPGRFTNMDRRRRGLGRVYRRARQRLPGGYDRWVGLIATWDKSYDRRMARDLVDRLVASFGDRAPGRLDQLFNHLERQSCDHLPKKVARLERECARLRQDKQYLPDLRQLKPDVIKEQVYAELADGPKAIKELARAFKKTHSAISAIGRRLRNEDRITSVWREGQCMWARVSSSVPRFISARDAIVEALKKGPMTYPALARDTGKAISTIKCALHCHLLKNGTVIRTKFGVYALAGTQPPYVSRGKAIVAALEKGPMTFQAIAREINNPPSSVPQFLEPLLEKGTVVRIGRGIYGLRGHAPVYVPTCKAIVSALTKKPMKLGPLVQHVIKLTKGTRSRGAIRTVLSRLVEQGAIKQDRRWGEYRLVRRMRALRG
jgi:hypothetical protein